MKAALFALALIVATVVLAGCHIGESTAPKPDPKMFLPKTGAAAGPPPSTPTGK